MKYTLALLTVFFTVFVRAYDFGVVDAHTPVKVNVELSNSTEHALRLEEVKSTCRCISVDWSSEVLPKGGTLIVPVEMNLFGMEGDIEKEISFRFIECPVPKTSQLSSLKPVPEAPLVTLPVTSPLAVLQLRGQSRLRLGLKPHNLAFGVIGEHLCGQVVRVELAGYTSEEARITHLSGSKEPIIPVTISEDARALLVTLPGKELLQAQGMISEVWHVETSDPEVKTITFPVSARFSSGLSVSPQRLTLASNEGYSSRTVTLRAEKGKVSFRVLSVEPKPRPWGKVEVRPRPLNGWQIVVTEIDTDQVRQFSMPAYLEVKTDLPLMETFQIPVQVEMIGGAK